VEDPVKSVIAIENVQSAIGQIAQATLRAVVGRHTLDETLSETDAINQSIREILDVQTEEWGVKVTVVELCDIQPPESMQRAMARQAEAEREKRAKIIGAQGEALAAGELANASDVMMAHPLALQLRNLQTLVGVAVDKNSTVVFPAPLMSTIRSSERSWNTRAKPPASSPPQTQPQPRPTESWCPMTTTDQPGRSPAPGIIPEPPHLNDNPALAARDIEKAAPAQVATTKPGQDRLEQGDERASRPEVHGRRLPGRGPRGFGSVRRRRIADAQALFTAAESPRRPPRRD